jgi:hypothetical protein
VACSSLLFAYALQVRALFVVGHASAEPSPDVLAVNVTEGERLRAHGDTATHTISGKVVTGSVATYWKLTQWCGPTHNGRTQKWALLLERENTRARCENETGRLMPACLVQARPVVGAKSEQALVNEHNVRKHRKMSLLVRVQPRRA